VKLVALFVYIFIMVLIGYYSMRRTRTVGDFFLANRSLGPWLSAFAYGTAYFSAVLFVGYAGRIGWGFGLSSLWIVVGNALVGSLLAWIVLARKTRRVTEELGTMTMPEFLEKRYHSHFLKVFSAFIIFIFLMPYSASVYMGLSYLFDAVVGIPYFYALLLMAALTGTYLIMGGYFAVTVNGLVQGIIMLFGALLLVFFVLSRPEVGGFAQAIENLRNIDLRLVSAVGAPGFWPLFGLVVLTSLGAWGLPQMVQKFYSIKSEKVIVATTIIATVFALVCAFSAYFSGALTHLFFNKLPEMGGKPNPELLMPQLVAQFMPTSFAIILLLLIFSASMSTLSSLVLVSSSAIAIDLLSLRSKKESVLLMRILCGVFIFFSLLIAFYRPTFIVNLMSISWGTTAGAFLAPYLYGLYWKRANATGAIVSMVCGLVIGFGVSWYYGFSSQFVPLIGSFAMLIPLGVFPLVSLLSAGVNKI